MKDPKREQGAVGKERSRELIGEMMLAKSVLEEKSELLDQKEEVIRELRLRERELEEELEETRGELERCTRELASSLEKARREGIGEVVEKVVRLTADYEWPQAPETEARLAERLIRLLQECYGLEVLGSAPGGLDPQIHQVVIAEHNSNGVPAVQVLRKGFRLEGKVLMPALVKVVEEKEAGAGHLPVWSPGTPRGIS